MLLPSFVQLLTVLIHINTTPPFKEAPTFTTSCSSKFCRLLAGRPCFPSTHTDLCA